MYSISYFKTETFDFLRKIDNEFIFTTIFLTEKGLLNRSCLIVHRQGRYHVLDEEPPIDEIYDEKKANVNDMSKG